VTNRSLCNGLDENVLGNTVFIGVVGLSSSLSLRSVDLCSYCLRFVFSSFHDREFSVLNVSLINNIFNILEDSIFLLMSFITLVLMFASEQLFNVYKFVEFRVCI
jgi:hypothetical protein